MRDLPDFPAPLPWHLTGRHVLAMLIAFFGVVFAVNGYFLVSALSTHTGVVAVEPYRKGLAYNLRIAADARQAALGWRDEIAFAPDGSVAIAILDRDGRRVRNLAVEGSIGRPSTAGHDQALRTKQDDGGLHHAATGPLGEGAWIVSIEVRISSSDAEPVYRARRRLWLKP